MGFFRGLVGNILYKITDFLSFLLDLIINIIDTIVSLVAGIARIISAGGCLLLFLLMSPFGWIILTNPVVILTVLFFVVFPILGTKFVSFLKYVKYIVTEYLYDRANYLIDGESGGFKSFNEYSHRYKMMEEEKRREAYRRQQQEQQRMWEERFKQWNEYQNQQGGQSYWGQNQGHGNYTYQNPSVEFKKKYEESCDLLGIGYDADKYQVKLAYRKKAKEYHPDINKSPNATEMFQKINDAYEFLNDDNIERYSKL